MIQWRKDVTVASVKTVKSVLLNDEDKENNPFTFLQDEISYPQCCWLGCVHHDRTQPGCSLCLHLNKMIKICQMLSNWTGMDKEKEAQLKPHRESLSLWHIKETVIERCYFPHSSSHLKHTAAHALFIQQPVNEREAARSSEQPFPAVILWVKEE